MIEQALKYLQDLEIPLLFIIGMMILASLLFSGLVKKAKLPAIVAYMIMGFILGPSVTGIINSDLLQKMDFLTKAILAFVAFKIGIEIDLREMRKKGKGIIITAISQSLGAMIVVTVAVYVLTGEFALALCLGAIAPASAPAGTVAVIDEYNAKGSFTHSLLYIVGIDDGLGVIIFGLLTPLAAFFITQSANTGFNTDFVLSFIEPIIEITISIIVGILSGKLFVFIGRDKKTLKYAMSLTFGFVILLSGICQLASLSFILTNMVFGLTIGNDKKHRFMKQIEEEDIGIIMPLFFLLFFTIAGANLHINMLSHMGLIAGIYIIGRATGKISGTYIGAKIGGLSHKEQQYLGFGTLSQAGVAIGLTLILKQQLQGVGPVIDENSLTMGDYIGQTIFTTITATSVFFEIIGPILAKYGLKKAGEITP
jgi:Kef-type K+ transport system membrane component KefB